MSHQEDIMSKKQITGIIVIIGLALFSLQVIAVAGSSEE